MINIRLATTNPPSDPWIFFYWNATNDLRPINHIASIAYISRFGMLQRIKITRIHLQNLLGYFEHFRMHFNRVAIGGVLMEENNE